MGPFMQIGSSVSEPAVTQRSGRRGYGPGRKSGRKVAVTVASSKPSMQIGSSVSEPAVTQRSGRRSYGLGRNSEGSGSSRKVMGAEYDVLKVTQATSNHHTTTDS